MYPPLVVDEKDDKWLLLKIILKFFETRTAKKELRKYGVSASFGVSVIKIVLTSMFSSIMISYVLKELKNREDINKFMKIREVPKTGTIRSYLSKLDEDKL